MQNFRQAYRPPESAAEPQAAERMKEVELAKPWQRLLAGAIDRILPIILLVMFLLRIEYTRAYVQAEMPWLLLLLPVGLVAGLLLGGAGVYDEPQRAKYWPENFAYPCDYGYRRESGLRQICAGAGRVFLCGAACAVRAVQWPGFGPYCLLRGAIAVFGYAVPQARQLSNAAGFDVANFGGEGVSAAIMKRLPECFR